MKTVEQRLKDEQEFHNKVFETDKRQSEVSRFYAINKRIHKVYDGFIYNEPQNKIYLEYGCGMDKDNRSTRLAKIGAEVHGIDISDYAIDHLTKEAQKENLDIDYQVMNAEDMTYPDNYFDVIYGAGILHHLDLEKAFDSISKKLKENGTAIFIEPLGHNPLINGFRNRTPDIRTDDEHPLLVTDFKLAKAYFKEVEIEYFYLATLAVPLLFKKNPPKSLINFSNAIDKGIFMLLPFMRKYAWQVVVRFSNPN